MLDLDRPLPVAWDGRRLEWRPWEPAPLVFVCDRTKRKNGLSHPSCSACGSTRPGLTASALIHPLASDTEPGEYLRRHRNGTPVYAQEPMPAYRYLRANRCVDCGHDMVVDFRDGEVWDLDPSDYGPGERRPVILDAGSRAVLQFEEDWMALHPTGSQTGKEEAVRLALGHSLIRHYQLLNRLIDDAGASAAFPQLCSRLRRIRDERASTRTARTNQTPRPL